MIWVWVLVLVVIIGAIAVVTAGRDDALAEVYDDRPDATLPTGRPLRAADLEAVRFSTAVRGYRMDEVDELLSRVQADLESREFSESREFLAAPAPEHETPDDVEPSAQPSGPGAESAAQSQPSGSSAITQIRRD